MRERFVHMFECIYDICIKGEIRVKGFLLKANLKNVHTHTFLHTHTPPPIQQAIHSLLCI